MLSDIDNTNIKRISTTDSLMTDDRNNKTAVS